MYTLDLLILAAGILPFLSIDHGYLGNCVHCSIHCVISCKAFRLIYSSSALFIFFPLPLFDKTSYHLSSSVHFVE
ncbi:hypothetical protein C8R41DRAFT_820502 [Lentinula lateritia]|uniref:Secreted protein n=1 Tax=Lentinula lateritia TaxID=40482 RepID=A0ABQ8VNP1_9AGAR|nr:hypothetical protein C8R41DRAFT_820502 [Lentinula lateritia]